MPEQRSNPGGPSLPPQEGRRAPDAGRDSRGVLFTGDLLLALGVLGLAAFLFAGALNIRVSPSYAHIGPRFFPFLVSGGLGACGLALLAQAARRAPAKSGSLEERPAASGKPPVVGDAPKPAVYWPSVAIVAAALAGQFLLMERAGFVVASALLFWAVAFAFGSRRYGRDILVGIGLAFVVYVVFTRLLGLHLPGGMLTTMLR
ncbi:MAG: tripartite tricarboxylate transporter TctB family protein [Firmicutes bacterium]|nr:tripartite tricarboxylate transporter TctB family protein [Bacillota bacterium]